MYGQYIGRGQTGRSTAYKKNMEGSAHKGVAHIVGKSMVREKAMRNTEA